MSAPKRGDVLWLEFDGARGHEQRGRRPCVILSPHFYNKKTGMALVVPISSRVKEYPLEVALPPNLKVTGAVLCDQLRLVNWTMRDSKLIQSLPVSVMEEILAKSRALLE